MRQSRRKQRKENADLAYKTRTIKSQEYNIAYLRDENKKLQRANNRLTVISLLLLLVIVALSILLTNGGL